MKSTFEIFPITQEIFIGKQVCTKNLYIQELINDMEKYPCQYKSIKMSAKDLNDHDFERLKKISSQLVNVHEL